MKASTVTLPRYRPMYAWANRILRVDLSDMTVRAEPSEPYLPDWLGARGLAARLCWDEYPEPVPAFDPANPLMIVPGALTGSRSPYSGRTNICAFSPQAWPHEWFTRSSIGGHFGGELKRAGYDALIVTGAADTPVRIRIVDDEVSIVPADDLWGLDTMDTIDALEGIGARGVRSLVIGPAGERLSRIATIQTASSSAAGQGGFGGVMGSKKLKAISVVGSGKVSLANPGRITALARALARDLPKGPRFLGWDLEKLNVQLREEGNGRAKLVACTEGCVTPCLTRFEGVPGVEYARKHSGDWFCVALLLAGFGEPGSQLRDTYDWGLSRRAAFECNVLANRYGLNHFDLLSGTAPWLIACQKAGLVSELNQKAMDWYPPQFWVHFLHAIAYREGFGDVLAEGGWRSAYHQHLGVPLVRTRYPGWGYPGHWDGHDVPFPYPYWLVTTLQWLSDTRDPFDSGHGYVWASMGANKVFGAKTGQERTGALEQIRALGLRAYGDADALDPYSGYRSKAGPAHYHTIRPVVKDCVPTDDFVFPPILDEGAPDGFRVFRDVEGLGDVEGPSVEGHLFAAGTGLEWGEAELARAAQRVATMERALQVRHWGRDRTLDESILPYFERPEMLPNSLLGEPQSLDRDKFAPVLTEFYRLHGWDTNGQPTKEGLEQVGLSSIHESMMAGATKTKEEIQ